jgi:N-acetylglucosamine-6-phosphate deacetylase
MRYYNANVFIDGQFVRGGFRVEKGRFAEVFAGGTHQSGTDLQGAYVIPGLVDIHVHGCGGADFSDGDYDGLVHMARCLAKQGTTTFAPAIAPLPFEPVELAMSTAVLLRRDRPEGCAWLAGAHMEGPFLSPEGKPDFHAFRSLFEFMSGVIGMVDVDPELPGAVEFIRQARELCVVSDGRFAAAERDFGGDLYTGLRRAVARGVPKEEAILSVTLNPARLMAVDYEVGSIAPYKRADFIACDENLERKQVFLEGKPVA